MPLIDAGQLIGALLLSFPSAQIFDDAQQAFITALAQQCAQAIQRARIYEYEAEARREAEQAYDLKRKFLMMISHELRTPLTAIKGFTTTMLAEDVTFSANDQREFLEIVNNESNRLGDLVEQIIDESQLQAGMMSITLEPQPVSAILNAATLQLHQLTANHRLVLDMRPDLPPVMADRQRVVQILCNLVGNAAQYSPPDTTICVTVTAETGYLRFDVTDQGPGISPEDREHAFESFWQVQSTRSSIQRGAGLGLAICEGLVKEHGGRIWIEDRPLPGTTISFTLPLA